jgi:hypothetical protein
MTESYVCLTGAPDPCEFENKEHHDATCQHCSASIEVEFTPFGE